MTRNEKKRLFTKILFRWHKTHYRDMPWRPPKSRGRDRASLDPYRVLVSEIMLQQTQVDRVRGKYAEFLKKFPNIKALARSPLGEVLRVWSGLGYNRRAKYLHDAAKVIVAEYGGKFPNDTEALRRLPGIGPSTAAAIRAFTYGRDEPMIDTNIRRILMRVFFGTRLRGTGLEKRTRPGLEEVALRPGLVRFSSPVPCDNELYLFAKTLIPKGKGREWNYAMLDLGATLCTARNHSARCPLMKLHGKVADFQYKKPQKKFAGSNRFYRGKILLLLTERKMATSQQIGKALKLSTAATSDILRDLKREQLVMFFRGKVMLPR